MTYMLFCLGRYLLITAAVLTYIEIGPGGEELWPIVQEAKEQLLQVDWGALYLKIKTHMANFLDAVAKWLASS